MPALYRLENRVGPDYNQAVKWWTKAAEQGHANAQYMLGDMYERGQGVGQSDREAVKCYTKAAEQGNAQAQFFVGRLYEKGQGVPLNDVIALSYYILASAGGEARAKIERDRLTMWMSPDQVAEAQGMAREFKIGGK